MLQSKAKEDQSKLKTLEKSLHFHLDSEQQEMTYLAKKQLQALSQEFQDNAIQHYNAKSLKNYSRNIGKPTSIRTTTTEYETRSFLSKNQAKSRIKPEKVEKNTRPTSSHQRKIKQSSHRSLPAKKIQYTKVNNLIFDQDVHHLPLNQQNTLNRYKTKIEFYSQQKVRKANGFNGFKAQPVSAATRRKYFQGTSKTSRISSRKYSNISEQQLNQNTNQNKLYSFNDTIGGDFTRFQSKTQRNVLKNHQNNSKQETERPASSRDIKIRLRPQFLRLIQKIKQKEEEQIKKDVIQIKGRRRVC